MFHEWDERSRDRDDLVCCHADEIDLVGVGGTWLAILARFALLNHKVAVLIDRGNGSGSDIFLFFESIHVNDVVAYARLDRNRLDILMRRDLLGKLGADRLPCLGHELAAALCLGVLIEILADDVTLALERVIAYLAIDAAIWRLEETILIETGIASQVAHQTDIRTFRSSDRTDAAIVGGMHVTHIEASALAGKTARAHGRETTLVLQLGQRIGLVHELRELG